MAIYWIMFALFAVGALTWQDESGRKSAPISFYAAIAIAVMIVGLRWQIGPDWQAYSYVYQSASRLTLEQVLQRSDPGFYTVAWVLDSNGAPFWALNLVMAIIFLIGLATFARTLPNPWLAVTVAVPVLIIVVGMNLIRQAAAMGFVFFALSHVGSKPLWKSLGWVMVASLFHASAIVVALLIGISYTRNRLAAFFLLIVSVIAVYYILLSTFDAYFQTYSHQLIDSGGVYFRLGINALPAVLLLVFRRRVIVPPQEYALWRNVALFSLLLLPMTLFIKSTTVVDRASIYAIPLQLVVLSAFPRATSVSSGRYANIAAIVLYSAIILFTYFSFGTHARYFAPYRSVIGNW